MTEQQIQNYVSFLNEELQSCPLEKLFQLTLNQWGRDKNQTIWWYWRCQYDNFDNHENDNLLK